MYNTWMRVFCLVLSLSLFYSASATGVNSFFANATNLGEPVSLTLADGAVEQWSYDGTGNVTAYVNPLGDTVYYVFDDAGQLTTVDYPTGLTDTSFSYDNAGRQVAMTDVSSTSSWTYNAASEITSLTTPQGSLSYTYNVAGQIATMVDSGVGTTTTTYDSAGRPALVTDAFGDFSGYSYDTAGRLSRKDNPNGTYELYSYDNRNRASSIVTKDSSNAVLQARSYTFDAASQITQVIEGGITTTFGYDLIGQLTSEVKSSGYSGSYTYDANGNRLTRTVNGVTENYFYDAGDKLTAITGGLDPRTFTYDAAGRTTGIVRSGGTTAFTYDYESRVTSITKPGMTSNSYSYNGLDTRVGVSDSLGSRNFKRNGIGVTAPVLSDGLANYTPSGEVRGSLKTTFHSALKNADIQTNSSGAVSASVQFDAFGNPLSGSGTWKSPFGYAGQFGYQQDADTGLKLLGHRYYDSDTGRFLTRDPIKDGRNWYGYCENDPITAADPTGAVFETLLDIAGIALDIKDIYENPRDPWAWGSLGWSVLATVTPGVPGSWSARAVKLGASSLDEVRIVKTTVEASELNLGKLSHLHNGKHGHLYRGRDAHAIVQARFELPWQAEYIHNNMRFDLVNFYDKRS